MPDVREHDEAVDWSHGKHIQEGHEHQYSGEGGKLLLHDPLVACGGRIDQGPGPKGQRLMDSRWHFRNVVDDIQSHNIGA